MDNRRQPTPTGKGSNTEKSQVNVRLSDASIAKLDFLRSRYGTQSTTLEVAIDRLYLAELRELGQDEPA